MRDLKRRQGSPAGASAVRGTASAVTQRSALAKVRVQDLPASPADDLDRRQAGDGFGPGIPGCDPVLRVDGEYAVSNATQDVFCKLLLQGDFAR